MTADRTPGGALEHLTLAQRFGAWPLYPTALAVAYVVSIWLQSSLDVPPLARPLAAATTIGIVLTTASVLLTRDLAVGGAVAGILVLGFIGGDDIRVVGLVVVALVLAVTLASRLRARESRFVTRRATGALNLVGLCLLVLLIARAVGQTLAGGGGLPDLPRVETDPSRVPPDIVVVLLDGHGRKDVLAEQYGEDISGFVSALESRGFDVSPRSRSNYMSTQMTLASMLNIAHLSDLALPAESDPAYLSGLRARIEQNRSFRLLRTVGYRIEAVSPGYEGVALRSADQFVDGGQLSELEMSLLANSAASHPLDLFAPDALSDQMRDRVKWNLNPDDWMPDLKAGIGSSQPSFVYVHVPSPHPPYLFDRDGDPVLGRPVLVAEAGQSASRDQSMVDSMANAYAGQLAYVDSLAIRALDEVIQRVPAGAVVIVMSDHGPDVHVDWTDLTLPETNERFKNFFAARTPGYDHLFGDAPTPVNLFPVLLNAYLGADLPLKSNSSFVGYPPRQPLVDVGDPDSVSH